MRDIFALDFPNPTRAPHWSDHYTGLLGPNDAFRTFYPVANIFSLGDYYLFSMDIPGMREEDIEISVDSTFLRVQGKRSFRSHSKNETDHESHEESFREFSRSFSLPEHVDREAFEAEYDRGVLKIMMPKTPKSARPKNITLKSNSNETQT